MVVVLLRWPPSTLFVLRHRTKIKNRKEKKRKETKPNEKKIKENN